MILNPITHTEKAAQRSLRCQVTASPAAVAGFCSQMRRWVTCRLSHDARNLLGKEGNQSLMDELSGKPKPAEEKKSKTDKQPLSKHIEQRQLFLDQFDELPLFDNQEPEP